MRGQEAAFLDEYKHTDRLVRDSVTGCEGVSDYISLMEKAPSRAASSVPSWESELKALKRLRRIRNSIAHDTDCVDCEERDVRELVSFRRKIIEGKDPLALMKSSKSSSRSKPAEKSASKPSDKKSSGKKSHGKAAARKKKPASKRGSLLPLWIFLIFAAVLILLAVRSIL